MGNGKWKEKTKTSNHKHGITSHSPVGKWKLGFPSKKKQAKRITAAERKYLRRVAGWIIREHIRNELIREELGLTPIKNTLEKRSLSSSGTSPECTNIVCTKMSWSKTNWKKTHNAMTRSHYQAWRKNIKKVEKHKDDREEPWRLGSYRMFRNNKFVNWCLFNYSLLEYDI